MEFMRIFSEPEFSKCFLVSSAGVAIRCVHEGKLIIFSLVDWIAGLKIPLDPPLKKGEGSWPSPLKKGR